MRIVFLNTYFDKVSVEPIV